MTEEQAAQMIDILKRCENLLVAIANHTKATRTPYFDQRHIDVNR